MATAGAERDFYATCARLQSRNRTAIRRGRIVPLVDSLSPRRRSRERGFQLATPIRWKLPLSPTLSPLVPRRERERGASAMVVVSRCAHPARPARRATAFLALRANSVRVTATMGLKPVWVWLAAPIPNPRRGPPPAAFARTTSARGSNGAGGESADETGYRISFPIVVRS